jgi:hypothetical protein
MHLISPLFICRNQVRPEYIFDELQSYHAKAQIFDCPINIVLPQAVRGMPELNLHRRIGWRYYSS